MIQFFSIVIFYSNSYSNFNSKNSVEPRIHISSWNGSDLKSTRQKAISIFDREYLSCNFRFRLTLKVDHGWSKWTHNIPMTREVPVVSFVPLHARSSFFQDLSACRSKSSLFPRQSLPLNFRGGIHDLQELRLRDKR